MATASSLLITNQDFERLQLLLHHQESEIAAQLQEEISRAELIPAEKAPSDLVTMNSKIRYQEASTGKEVEMTLVYPKDADLESGKISVLAPVGAALIGLRKGQSIEWTMPNGKTRKLTVLDVLYQPEASGDWTL